MGLALALANIGGSAAVFSPTNISSLRMWLDPTRGVVGTNPVTAWADQQGNVSTFTPAGNGDIKTGTGINGKPTIEINTGVAGSRLSSVALLSDFLSASAWWCAMVWKYTGPALQNASTFLNPLIIGSIGTYWQLTVSTQKLAATQYDGAYKSDQVTVATQTHYAICRYNGTVVQVSLDGGAFDAGTAAGAIQLPGDHPISLGNTTQPSAPDFIGSYGDILAGNAALSASDATSLNAYLKARYGL